jgi:hypothetical protein
VPARATVAVTAALLRDNAISLGTLGLRCFRRAAGAAEHDFAAAPAAAAAFMPQPCAGRGAPRAVAFPWQPGRRRAGTAASPRKSPDPYPSLACRVLTTQNCIGLPLTLFLPPTSSVAPTDLMYEQTKALMEGKSVMKPIYNHVSGLLDPAEKIDSPKILVRVRL